MTLQCTGSISTSCTDGSNKTFYCYNVLAVFLPVVPFYITTDSLSFLVTMYWQYFYQLYLWDLNLLGPTVVTMYWQYFYQLYLYINLILYFQYFISKFLRTYYFNKQKLYLTFYLFLYFIIKERLTNCANLPVLL